MSSLCQHCGENAFDANDQVCHGCGTVEEEIVFESGFNPFSSAETKPKLHQFRTKKDSGGLTYGMGILDNLSHQYNLTHLKSEARDLLKKVHSKRAFSTKQDIGVMAGCCLIHVQKKGDQFVSLTDLCRKLGCSKKKGFKFTNVLKKHCNTYTEGQSINHCMVDDITDTNISQKLEFSIASVFTSLSIDNKDKLMEKTKALMELANSCWLTSGRSPEGIIVAAVYLCWKSMYPHNKLSFKKFCSDYSLPYTKGAPRLCELKQMLVKLGENIPSVSSNFVNEKNVFFHLNYILENSETLRNDLLSNEFTAKEIDKKEYSAFRKTKLMLNNNRQSERDGYASDMCASDIEISDTEISSYIRTKEQVEAIKVLRGEKDS